MSWNKYSRAGLVLCVAGGLTLSGCAGGAWGRFIGKREQPSPKLNLAWSKLKEEEGKLTEARTGYETVLAAEPNNVDAILGMARMNVKAQRLVDAEQGYGKALTLQPKSPVVLSECGKFYVELQRWDKAIPLLQDAQRIEPHEKSHQFTLAVALTKAGRTSEALPHFTEAVGEAAAHYNVGRLLVETGKKTEAEEQFKLALAKDPALTDAEFFLNEIRTERSGTPPAPTKLATAKPPTRSTLQVSGTGSADQTKVTPAAGKKPQTGRPPLYPHGGYEELPPPDDLMDGASLSKPSLPGSLSQIVQASNLIPSTPPASSAATPPKPLPELRLLPAPSVGGPQIRIGTQQPVR